MRPGFKEELREWLVFLYDDNKRRLEMVVRESGINKVRDSDDIEVYCYTICNEAERQVKFVPLIERVIKDYDRPELRGLLRTANSQEGDIT